MNKSLEQLAEEAKEAQRVYDKAVHEAQKTSGNNRIIATSTAKAS